MLPSDGPFRVLVQDAEKERELWKETRRTTGVSASKVPAILGLSPFESPMSCWAWYRGDLPDPDETPQMRWGTKLQDLVAETVAADEGLEYTRDERLLQSVDNEIFLATPDGWFRADDALDLGEVKTTKSGSYWEEGIPSYIEAQVQAQLFVTGMDRARIAVFFRSEADHFWDFIERDEAWINNVMLPRVEEFWEKVKSGEPPDADGLDRTAEAIKAVWPRAEVGKIVTLGDEMLALHEELEEIKAANRVSEKRKKEIENILKAKLEDAEVGHIEGTDVAYTYKNQRREAYSVEAKEYRVLRKSKWKEA
jgi:putative phage-type endonuclease